MATSRVFLVRHGATVLSAEDRFAGSTDAELSEEGREQARRLAERLAGERVAEGYASPLGERPRRPQSLRTGMASLPFRKTDSTPGDRSRAMGGAAPRGGRV